MKRAIIFLLAVFAISFVFAQEKNKARVEIIKAKPDMVAEFEKGLAAHVLKFHSKATDPVNVYQTMSGSRSGEYHFVQGPMSWADIAGKQYSGDHSDDWNKNVAKYTLSSETHYYTFQPDLSYNVNEGEVEWSILSFITINAGTNSTYQHILKTNAEALSKAKDGRSYSYYSHTFAGRDNEHNYAAVFPLKGGLKDLDQSPASLNKILTEHIGPNAVADNTRNGDLVYKKIETMLIKRMANLSSK